MTAPPPPGAPPTGRIVAVVMLALVVAAGAGVAGLVILMTDSDESSGGSTGWNAVAAVDFLDGDVVLFGPDGDRLDRIATGIDDARAHQVSPRHLVLEGLRDDRETIAIVDTSSGEVLDFDLGDDIARGDRRNLTVRTRPGTDVFMLADDAQPGTAYLMTVDGEIVDIGREAGWDEPFIVSAGVQTSPDGSVLGVLDAGGDIVETALITLPDLDVTVVDGGFVTLSNDLVWTRTATDDGQFEVATFDLDGSSIGSFETDRFVLAIPGPDDDLITASDDGDVVRWTTDGDADRLASADTGDEDDFARMARTVGSDPVIAVAGADGNLLLVGSDGRAVEGINVGEPIERYDLGSDCLPVITETSVAIVDTATGTVVADATTGDGLPGLVGGSAQGGCVVSVFGEEEFLLGEAETVDFDARETLAGLSDDGTAFAVRSRDGEFEIRAYGDATTDAVDLDARESSRIYFVER